MFKIAFLDRDGVINKSEINNGYIGAITNFKWMPGAIKAIKYLKSLNYKVVVVSNQSGIARGYFKMKDVNNIHGHIKKKLQKNQTKIDKFLFCPYHKDGVVKKYTKHSLLRKPNIGMFKIIDKIWKVDRKESFMIGDQKTDMQFAKKAKIKGFKYNEKNLYNFIKRIKFIKNKLSQ